MYKESSSWDDGWWLDSSIKNIRWYDIWRTRYPRPRPGSHDRTVPSSDLGLTGWRSPYITIGDDLGVSGYSGHFALHIGIVCRSCTNLTISSARPAIISSWVERSWTIDASEDGSLRCDEEDEMGMSCLDQAVKLDLHPRLLLKWIKPIHGYNLDLYQLLPTK